jgi:hypothetical protein
MKRALKVLPLLALALIVGALLLRRPLGSPDPKSAPPATPQESPSSQAPVLPSGVKIAPPGAPSASVTGSLRFAITMRGQPATDARIYVQRAGTQEFMNFKTEPDGTQLLHGLTAGEYTIQVQQEDAIPYNGEVVISPPETVLATIELKVGGRIMGTVTDRSGRPVPDTMVLLLNGVTRGMVRGDHVTTDAKGQYAVKGITPGTYGVRFRHLDYKPLDKMGLVFRNSPDDYTVDATIEVGARLTGRVVDESDVPIEGAEILAGNSDSGAISKSGADGSFAVGGLTDQPTNVSAAKSGYGKVVQRNLPGNTTGIVFRLPKAGTVLGRLVIDQIPPQTQITLSRFDEELRRVIQTDSRFFSLPTTGTFAFADIPPGTYWIDVQVEGYEPLDRPQVVVASGQIVREMTITMKKK